MLVYFCGDSVTLVVHASLVTFLSAYDAKNASIQEIQERINKIVKKNIIYIKLVQ